LAAHEVVYEKSIGTKMNDLDFCLEFISRSCPPLRLYIRRWISRKPLREAWFQRSTNRWPMGYQMVTWPMTSRHVTPKCAIRSAILATAWLL